VIGLAHVFCDYHLAIILIFAVLEILLIQHLQNCEQFFSIIISYKGDAISRLSRLIYEIWRETDRQTVKAATETEGCHTLGPIA